MQASFSIAGTLFENFLAPGPMLVQGRSLGQIGARASGSCPPAAFCQRRFVLDQRFAEKTGDLRGAAALQRLHRMHQRPFRDDQPPDYLLEGAEV